MPDPHDTLGLLPTNEGHRDMDAMEHLRKMLPIVQEMSSILNSETNQDKTVLGRLSSIEEDIEELTDAVANLKGLSVDDIKLILSNQDGMKKALQAIAATLGVPKSTIQIQFEGEPLMAGGQITNKQTIAATAIETDDQGQPVTIDPASATWSVDDTAVATVVGNPDGSGTFTPVAVGKTVVRLTDNGQTPPVVGTNTLEVTKGPNALTITFGNPQDPTA